MGKTLFLDIFTLFSRTHADTHTYALTYSLASSFIILHHIILWPIAQDRWQHCHECVHTCVLARAHMLVCVSPVWLGLWGITQLWMPACANCSQLAVTKQLVSLDMSPPVPGQTGRKPWGQALWQQRKGKVDGGDEDWNLFFLEPPRRTEAAATLVVSCEGH